MHTFTRRLAVLTAMTLALSPGMLTLNSGPAAAASCWNTGCYALDPQNTGCSVGGTNVDGRNTSTGAYVNLRKSSICGAMWARYEHVFDTTGGPVGGLLTVETQRGTIYTSQIAGYRHEIKWTRMVAQSDYARACLEYYHQGDRRVYCTGWH